jgi:hypothetical protein
MIRNSRLDHPTRASHGRHHLPDPPVQIRTLSAELRAQQSLLSQTTDLDRRAEIIDIIEGLHEQLDYLREEQITSGCVSVPFPPPPPKVRISHVEHTQAIQTRGTNDVRLVAGKETVLRVYVNHPFPGGTLTGKLFSPRRRPSSARR